MISVSLLCGAVVFFTPPASVSSEHIGVIGAGISGLAAARGLVSGPESANLTVSVLEARGRDGGRVWTARDRISGARGAEVDLGASWVHGWFADEERMARRRKVKPLVAEVEGGILERASQAVRRGLGLLQTETQNPMIAIAREAGATAVKTSFDDLLLVKNGAKVTAADGEAAYATYSALMAEQDDAREGLEGQDTSLAAALAAVDTDKVLSDPNVAFMLSTNAEFTTGASTSEASALYWDDDKAFGEGDVVFPDGYDKVLDPLRAGVNVTLNTRVTKIDADSPSACGGGSRVHVAAAGGASFCFDRVIVTVPLGVLKAGAITFNPPLSSSKVAAISRVGFGVVNKVAARFDTAFWGSQTFLGSASVGADRGLLRYWINTHKVTGTPVILGVAIGDGARALEDLSDTEIRSLVDTRMAELYGAAATPVREVAVTRWSKDEFALGSYSYAATGVKTGDWDVLSEPAAGGRILFAGEHTSPGYRGTTHGAVIAGRREAERVITGVAPSEPQGVSAAARVTAPPVETAVTASLVAAVIIAGWW